VVTSAKGGTLLSAALSDSTQPGAVSSLEKEVLALQRQRAVLVLAKSRQESLVKQLQADVEHLRVALADKEAESRDQRRVLSAAVERSRTQVESLSAAKYLLDHKLRMFATAVAPITTKLDSLRTAVKLDQQADADANAKAEILKLLSELNAKICDIGALVESTSSVPEESHNESTITTITTATTATTTTDNRSTAFKSSGTQLSPPPSPNSVEITDTLVPKWIQLTISKKVIVDKLYIVNLFELRTHKECLLIMVVQVSTNYYYYYYYYYY